jgi:hypothetical protein
MTVDNNEYLEMGEATRRCIWQSLNKVIMGTWERVSLHQRARISHPGWSFSISLWRLADVVLTTQRQYLFALLTDEEQQRATISIPKPGHNGKKAIRTST